MPLPIRLLILGCCCCCIAAAQADLFVTKSGNATASAGSNVTYTITLTNLGPDAAGAVTLDDSLPGGVTFVSFLQNSGPSFTCSTPTVDATGTVSCSLASMASAASAVFTLT